MSSNTTNTIITTGNEDSNTALNELIHAIMNGDYHEVESILSKSTCNNNLVNEIDIRTGYTPLCRACCYGHMDIIHLLLSKYNANVSNCVNYSATTTTPLHIATMKGYTSMIRLLLHYHSKQQYEKELQLEQQQKDQQQHEKQQQRHDLHGGDDDHYNDSSFTHTHSNSNNNNNITNAGANTSIMGDIYTCVIINVKNNVGWTLLYMATLYHNEKLVLLLLQYGADVTVAENKDGDTPLHLACRYGYETIIQILLSHVNNVIFQNMISCKNNIEQIPYDIIVQRNDQSLISLFDREITKRSNRYNIYKYLLHKCSESTSYTQHHPSSS